MHQEKICIGIPLFPEFDLLDVTGPVEILGKLSHVDLFYVAATLEPIQALPPMAIIPNRTFFHKEHVDILLVPGGKGLGKAMEDKSYMDYLRQKGASAEYVVGVCAGSLLLAAAGLLNGHVATTHWNSRTLLELFPEVTLAEGFPRYVVSGNRITSGGVSAGLDQALAIVAMIRGEQVARNIQLQVQYDPDPPYRCGTPLTADPVTYAQVSEASEPRQQERLRQITKKLA